MQIVSTDHCAFCLQRAAARPAPLQAAGPGRLQPHPQRRAGPGNAAGADLDGAVLQHGMSLHRFVELTATAPAQACSACSRARARSPWAAMPTWCCSTRKNAGRSAPPSTTAERLLAVRRPHAHRPREEGLPARRSASSMARNGWATRAWANTFRAAPPARPDTRPTRAAPMHTEHLRIDGATCCSACRCWRRVGATGDGGCCRLALTDDDRAGRDLVCGWMRELGLQRAGRPGGQHLRLARRARGPGAGDDRLAHRHRGHRRALRRHLRRAGGPEVVHALNDGRRRHAPPAGGGGVHQRGRRALPARHAGLAGLRRRA